MHTDDMNDFVLMGLARDMAEAEARHLQERVAELEAVLQGMVDGKVYAYGYGFVETNESRAARTALKGKPMDKRERVARAMAHSARRWNDVSLDEEDYWQNTAPSRQLEWLATADAAIAALDRIRQEAREEALREAADVAIDYGKQQYIANVVHQPQYADDIADDAQEIAGEILDLITRGQTKRPRASVSPDHSWEDKTNG